MGEIHLLNPNKQYESFLGIGAITDASAEVFAQLSESNQLEFLDADFGKEN